MAVRVSATDVKNIISTDLTDTQIAVFIQAANLFVNHHLSDRSISEDLLTEIERWVAAHFIASGPDPREKEVRIHDAHVIFEGATGRGLEFSRYGQQAVILDPTGRLKQAFKPRSIFSVQGET